MASSGEESPVHGCEPTRKYRLNDCQDGAWVIFDVADNTVFSGSLSDCEAWLDRAENLEGETGFLSFIRHLLGLR